MISRRLDQKRYHYGKKKEKSHREAIEITPEEIFSLIDTPDLLHNQELDREPRSKKKINSSEKMVKRSE